MATDKKEAKKPVALQDMDAKGRSDMLAEKRRELREAQVAHKAGELVNPRKLRSLRRDVARIMTEENKPSKDEETK